METVLPWVVHWVSAAVGGNIVGSLLRGLSLGTVGNSIAGLVGGGITIRFLDMGSIATGSGVVELETVIGSIASGAVGGGVLIVVIGMLKRLRGK